MQRLSQKEDGHHLQDPEIWKHLYLIKDFLWMGLANFHLLKRGNLHGEGLRLCLPH